LGLQEMRAGKIGMVLHQFGNHSLDTLKHLLEVESSNGRALAQNPADNPVCAVLWDDNNRCILVEWRGYASTLEFRFIHEVLISLIEQYRATKILGDDTHLVTIHAEDQAWVLEEWMPRAIAAGLRIAATKKPNGYFGQSSVEYIQSNLPSGITIRSFEQLEDAREWLARISTRPVRPNSVENQPWYPRWHRAMEAVIAAREARDLEEPGTPAWDDAETKYRAALAAYQAIAAEIK
jgi:hypothetical protein